MNEKISNPRKIKFNIASAFFILLFHCIAAFYLYKKGEHHDTEYYYWAAAFIMVASLPYLIALLNKKFVFFEPLYLFLGGFVITHTLPLFFSIDLDRYEPYLLALVMKAALVGVIAFIIGYLLKWGEGFAKKLPLRNFMLTDEALARLPLKLYILWMCLNSSFFIVFKSQTDNFYFIQLLKRISIYAALMIDTYLYFSPTSIKKRGKTKYLLRCIIFFLAEIASCFLAGFSGQMIMPAALMVLAFIKAKRSISPILIIVMSVIVVIFLNYAVPFTKAFRSNYWGGNDFRESLDSAFEKISNMENSERLEISVGRSSAALQISTLGFELREEKISIKVHADFLDFLSRFIPRFIWPNKPIVDYNKIGKQLGLIAENDYTTSVGLSLLGGFILSGGFFGIIIGMFLIGLILRIYWNWLMVRSQENFLTFAIYLILIYSWMFVGEEFYISLHSNVAFLIYAYFLSGFIKRRQVR